MMASTKLLGTKLLEPSGDEVDGVNLPANVCFTHNGSNSLYIGHHIFMGTTVAGVVERMVLRPDGHVLVYVSGEKAGRLVLTASGMLLLLKTEAKP